MEVNRAGNGPHTPPPFSTPEHKIALALIVIGALAVLFGGLGMGKFEVFAEMHKYCALGLVVGGTLVSLLSILWLTLYGKQERAITPPLQDAAQRIEQPAPQHFPAPLPLGPPPPYEMPRYEAASVPPAPPYEPPLRPPPPLDLPPPQPFVPQVANPGYRMTITIRLLSGRTFSLPLHSHDTVASIKQRVFEREGIPPQKCNLLCRGMSLRDDARDIGSYGVAANETLHVTAGVRGGPETTNLDQAISNIFNLVFVG